MTGKSSGYNSCLREVVLFLGGDMRVGLGIAIKYGNNGQVDSDTYKCKNISVTGTVITNPMSGSPSIPVDSPAQIVSK